MESVCIGVIVQACLQISYGIPNLSDCKDVF